MCAPERTLLYVRGYTFEPPQQPTGQDSWGKAHGAGLTGQDTRGKTHWARDSRGRTHGARLTGQGSRGRTHGAGLTRQNALGKVLTGQDSRRHARTGCSHVLTRARRCTRTGTLTRTGSSHVLWPTSWPKLSPARSCLRLCLLPCNLLALLVRWSPILGVVAHVGNRFRCRRGHAVARAARSRRRP